MANTPERRGGGGGGSGCLYLCRSRQLERAEGAGQGGNAVLEDIGKWWTGEDRDELLYYVLF